MNNLQGVRRLSKSLSSLFFLLFIFLISLSWGSSLQAAERGKLIGGVPHAAPDWFKESFLDISEDVEEASAENRHVMLFFQLNDCPYCDRMLTESFEAEPLQGYIREHFDVIAVNVRGDREIAFNEEISVLEKELAEHLQVRATPAILFLDSENNSVVRVDGYRAPKRFQHILNYVSSKGYEKRSLSEHLDKHLERNIYQLRDNPLFTNITDLSAVAGPLMLVFEDGSCYDCDEFHEKLLAHQDVQTEIKPYTVVRLDTDTDTEIVDPAGNKTTAKALADELKMTYRPGVVIYDEGKLVRRSDSLLYSFHFKEGLRYIAGGHYKKEDYRSYSQRRREELLAAGVTINLAE
ncbi:MAG: thioredoxin family protein [Thiolinea sp.]